MADVSMKTYFKNKILHGPPKATPSSSCKGISRAILSSSPNAIQLIEQCTDKVNQTFKKLKKIGLLHLTALADDTSIIGALCKAAKNPLPKDKTGNTPLHLRALISNATKLTEDPFYQTYKESCELTKAQVNKKNAYGLSAAKLHAFANSLETLQKTPEAAYNPDGKHSTMIKMTPSVSFEDRCLGDFQYSQKAVTTPKALIDFWLNFDPPYSAKYQKSEALQNYFISPPALSVRTSLLDQTSCGVFANQDIPENQMVSIYSGEFVVKNKQEQALSPVSDYYFDMKSTENNKDQSGFEALNIRSEAAMIQDGPPNVHPGIIYNAMGLQENRIFTSLGLKKGQELTFDYGATHPVKLLDYKINNLDRILDVLNDPKYPTVNFGDYLFQIVEENANEQGEVDMSFSNSSPDLIKAALTVKYIFVTPKVSFDLIKKGHLKHFDLKAIVRAESVSPNPGIATFPMLNVHVYLAYFMSSFQKKLMQSQDTQAREKAWEVIDQNYSRFMQPHQDNVNYGNLIFMEAYISCIENAMLRLYSEISAKDLKDIVVKLFEEELSTYKLDDHLTSQEKQDNYNNKLLQLSSLITNGLQKDRYFDHLEDQGTL